MQRTALGRDRQPAIAPDVQIEIAAGHKLADQRMPFLLRARGADSETGDLLMSEGRDAFGLRTLQDVGDMARAEAFAGGVDDGQDRARLLGAVDERHGFEADIAIAAFVLPGLAE